METYDLRKLSPLEIQADPQMPIILPEWKQEEFAESGVCYGAFLHSLTLVHTRKDKPVYNLVIFAWRGMYPIAVKFDLSWNPISIWIDFNNDNKADEYYVNMHHYRIEYGRGKWFCECLKRFLDKY